MTYINACMWNLEKWYRWIYLRAEIETQTENKCQDTKGRKAELR